MIPQSNLARSELSWISVGHTTGSVSLDAKHDYNELGMLHGWQYCDKCPSFVTWPSWSDITRMRGYQENIPSNTCQVTNDALWWTLMLSTTGNFPKDLFQLPLCTCLKQTSIKLLYLICFLTLWGRARWPTTWQTTFTSAFPWMKTFEFCIEFNWNMFFRV